MPKDWKAINRRRRTRTLRVTLDPQLVAAMRQDAALSGVTMSEYVARLATGRVLRQQPELEVLAVLAASRNDVDAALRTSLSDVVRTANELKTLVRRSPDSRSWLDPVGSAVYRTYVALKDAAARIGAGYASAIGATSAIMLSTDSKT